jgi:thiol:disulfide interchange protein DsbD
LHAATGIPIGSIRDAGIPTDIKWELPEGWRVGGIQWPIPLKLQEPGDIQIYGYHDEVL